MTAFLLVAWPLLRKYWQLAAILALAGVLIGACHQRDTALRESGALRERVHTLTANYHRDSVLVMIRDSVVRVDTVRLTQRVTQYDTLRSTLTLTDTVQVKQFVAVADSTVRACRETVSAFARSCAAKDTVIADLQALLKVREATPAGSPARLSWTERLLWAAAGAAVDRATQAAIRH